MPLPVLFDKAHEYLFADERKMMGDGLPKATINHILRLRDAYNFWLNSPTKRDKEIVARMIQRDGIGKSQAYEDLKIIKALLGSFQKTTKEYNQYLFTEGILAAIEKANNTGNVDAVIKGWATFAKFNKLDKEEPDTHAIDIAPQPFKPTDDPTVIGIKPIANIREKIKSLKEKYWSEDVQDVEFEQIEYNEDDIFKPKNGGSQTNLSK